METRKIDLRDRMIYLGKQGENHARKIVFDLTDWITMYGEEGQAVLLHERSCDVEAYPASITRTGAEAAWIITETDNACPGGGRAELQYVVDGTVAKSRTYETVVDASLGEGSEDIPDAAKPWVDAVAQAGAKALANADRAEKSEKAAASSEKSAKQYAETAQNGASAALNAALGAMASRDAAERSSAEAEADADRAGRSAETAAKSAESAEDSAGDAKGHAKKAEDAAEIASEKEKSAKDAEETAKRASADAGKYAAQAETASGRYPYIDKTTGTWWVWDVKAGKFTNTGVPATGEGGGEGGGSGAPGYSPTATVEQTDTGAKITITDVNGTTTATVNHGESGKDGEDGAPGYSPTATVEQTSTGAKITITDANGTTTATVTNGKDGEDGQDGAPGNDYVLSESDKTEIAEMVGEKIDYIPKSGGTMTGALVAQNNTSYAEKQVRNVFIVESGSSLPSGSNGDICIVYTP